eukprot:6289171-Prymnesium_polylepis.1
MILLDHMDWLGEELVLREWATFAAKLDRAHGRGARRPASAPRRQFRQCDGSARKRAPRQHRQYRRSPRKRAPPRASTASLTALRASAPRASTADW